MRSGHDTNASVAAILQNTQLATLSSTIDTILTTVNTAINGSANVKAQPPAAFFSPSSNRSPHLSHQMSQPENLFHKLQLVLKGVTILKQELGALREHPWAGLERQQQEISHRNREHLPYQQHVAAPEHNLRVTAASHDSNDSQQTPLKKSREVHAPPNEAGLTSAPGVESALPSVKLVSAIKKQQNELVESRRKCDELRVALLWKQIALDQRDVEIGLLRDQMAARQLDSINRAAQSPTARGTPKNTSSPAFAERRTEHFQRLWRQREDRFSKILFQVCERYLSSFQEVTERTQREQQRLLSVIGRLEQQQALPVDVSFSGTHDNARGPPSELLSGNIALRSPNTQRGSPPMRLRAT